MVQRARRSGRGAWGDGVQRSAVTLDTRRMLRRGSGGFRAVGQWGSGCGPGGSGMGTARGRRSTAARRLQERSSVVGPCAPVWRRSLGQRSNSGTEGINAAQHPPSARDAAGGSWLGTLHLCALRTVSSVF